MENFVHFFWNTRYNKQQLPTLRYIIYMYLNSETDAAQLQETVDLAQTQPVVVVACRWSKSITISRPAMVERHRTSSDHPLHEDPAIDSQ